MDDISKSVGNDSINSKIVAARCHEIQTCLGNLSVPEYEQLVIIGMAVKVALHIRGLPLINYEVLKLVCHHFLNIPTIALPQVVRLLAEIEFVYLQTQGSTIKSVLPDVPYYDGLYEGVGEFLENETTFTEAEQLTLSITDRLAAAPENVDRLRNSLGVETDFFKRNLDIGQQGRFLTIRRHRGRDIAINPTYFSENAEIFSDHVAASGSQFVAEILDSLKQYQGWPLAVIKNSAKIGQIEVETNQIRLLERLA